MEIEGKIIQLLDEQKGEGKNGTWRKKEYVLETEDKYPKKVCFNLWGDRIDEFSLKQGEQVRVYFDLESREFNGRWYTDVKAWKVEKNSTASSIPPDGPEISHEGPMNTPPPLTEDDLPF